MLLNPMDRFLLNKGRKEGIKEGKLDTARNGKLDTARNLLKRGFSIDEVVEITKLSHEDILNIE